MYKDWINGVLGLVVLGLAFVDLPAVVSTWTLAVSGVVVAVNSFWTMITKPSGQGHKVLRQM